jgi:hypothetical protein
MGLFPVLLLLALDRAAQYARLGIDGISPCLCLCPVAVALAPREEGQGGISRGVCRGSFIGLIPGWPSPLFALHPCPDDVPSKSWCRIRSKGQDQQHDGLARWKCRAGRLFRLPLPPLGLGYEEEVRRNNCMIGEGVFYTVLVLGLAFRCLL